MKLSNLDGIQTVNKEEQKLTGGFFFIPAPSIATADANALAVSFNPFRGQFTATNTFSAVTDFSAQSSSHSSAAIL